MSFDPPTDVYCCIECEALLISDDNLCDDCSSGYVDWLIQQDQQRASSAFDSGRTPGNAASPDGPARYRPHTDDPEDNASSTAHGGAAATCSRLL